MNICKRSLESSDFNKYDIVADKKLYRSEMSTEQFHCFVEQLIQTSDRDVLKTFVAAIQNDLWEAIRKVLPRIARKKKISKPVKELIKKLMRHEFSNKKVRGDVEVGYQTEYRNISMRQTGLSISEKYMLHLIAARGNLKINIPIRAWRLKSNTRLSVGQNWGDLQQKMRGAMGDANFRDKTNFRTVDLNSDLAVLKRNSRFKTKIKGGFVKNWNPLADMLESQVSLGGLFTLRRPLGSGFSLTGTVDWKKKKYTDPLNPMYNKRSSDKLTAGVEASYLFKRAGLILRYDYSDKDSVESLYSSKESAHSPTLLAHIAFKKGYLRIGAGGGVWDSSLMLLGETAATKGGGAEAHGNVEFQWRPKRWMIAGLKARGAANYSSGDYNGWFPSWSSEVSLIFALGKIFIKAAGKYEGFHRNLEEKQTKHSGSAEATLAWRPSNRWNIALIGGYTAAKQTGDQVFSERTWQAQTMIGFRVLKKPDAWLQVGGGAVGYQYKQGDTEHELLNVMGGASFKLRF